MNGLLMHTLYWFAVGLGLLMTFGTLLSTTRYAHWFVRGWDFPRLQIAGAAAASLVVLLLLWTGSPVDWATAIAVSCCILWQGYNVLPFTTLWRTSVKRKKHGDGDRSIRLVISNVLMENDDFDRWLEVVRAADPDVILAVEVDEGWYRRIEKLKEEYPHVLAKVQNNHYGMALFSRLEFHDPEIRYLVQDDIPSIHVDLTLPGGELIDFHGVHPRPPEPISDQDSAPRDAEIVLLARDINGQAHQPRIIAGDFNDVAWSRTTHLFLKLSGLLDPRRGRGLFSTFDANRWYFRFPLDHIFHSSEFKLVDLRRLPHVGSDHFPMFIELCLDADGPSEQHAPEQDESDREEAEEKLEVAAQQKQEDKPSRHEQ